MHHGALNNNSNLPKSFVLSDKTPFKSNIKLQNSYCNTTYTSQSVFVSKPVCLCKLCDAHDTPTFKTEALHLVSNVQLVYGLYTTKLMANKTFLCSSSTVINALCY